MKCIKCNEIIEDGAPFCKHCGMDQNKVQKNVGKNKKLLITILITVVLLVASSFVIYKTGFIIELSYKNELNKNNYEMVQEEYINYLARVGNDDKIDRVNFKKFTSLVEKAIKNDTSFEDAMTLVDELNKNTSFKESLVFKDDLNNMSGYLYNQVNEGADISSNDPVFDWLKEYSDLLDKKYFSDVQALFNSKKAYTTGLKKLEGKKYLSALENFDEVIEADINSMIISEQLIEAKAGLIESEINEATQLIGDRNYIDALVNLNESFATNKRCDVDNTQIKTLIDSTILEAETEFSNKITSLQSENQYKQAYTYAHDIKLSMKSISNDNKFDMNTIYNNSLELYVSDVEKTINVNLDNKNFEDAVVLFNELDELNKGDAIKATIRNAIVTEKNRLLGKTSSKYDEYSKTYTYVPKGYSTRYINVSWNSHVIPRIIGNDLLLFAVDLGFHASDWVFFDDIYIVADGESYTIEMDYGDRDTQVIGGGNISEWSIQTLSYSVGHEEHFEIFKKIANSDTSKIKFSGSGYREYTISSSEKQNLRLFISIIELAQLENDLKY